MHSTFWKLETNNDFPIDVPVPLPRSESVSLLLNLNQGPTPAPSATGYFLIFCLLPLLTMGMHMAALWQRCNGEQRGK